MMKVKAKANSVYFLIFQNTAIVHIVLDVQELCKDLWSLKKVLVKLNFVPFVPKGDENIPLFAGNQIYL